jgi:hypothetical protein
MTKQLRRLLQKGTDVLARGFASDSSLNNSDWKTVFNGIAKALHRPVLTSGQTVKFEAGILSQADMGNPSPICVTNPDRLTADKTKKSVRFALNQTFETLRMVMGFADSPADFDTNILPQINFNRTILRLKSLNISAAGAGFTEADTLPTRSKYPAV